MKTLIIYDNEGKVFSEVAGEYTIPKGGVQFLEAEVPVKKHVVGVDVSVTPHQVILEDIPKSDVEVLEDRVLQQEQAIFELAEMLAMGGMGNG